MFYLLGIILKYIKLDRIIAGNLKVIVKQSV
jgi:hypothetical protein